MPLYLRKSDKEPEILIKREKGGYYIVTTRITQEEFETQYEPLPPLYIDEHYDW